MTAPTEPPALPPQISTPDVWDLHARADLVEAAAGGWRAVGKALGSTADEVNGAAKSLLGGGWQGAAADSYDEHRVKLVADLDHAQQQAEASANALADASGALRAAQSHLTGEWGRVTGVPLTYDAPMHLLFSPTTYEQSTTVVDSINQCQEIRGGLDGSLQQALTRFRQAATEFATVAASWNEVAEGTSSPFEMPPEATRTVVIVDGDRVIVNTGTGDDQVTVGIDPQTGLQTVEVNGQTSYFAPGADIVVRGGEGDDTISVAPGTGVHVTLIGGEGEDKLSGGTGADTILGLDGKDQVYSGGGNDRVSAGAGRDYVDAGAGDDIASGGLGDDIVYGLSGNDALTGGEGQDYLEGATGNDTIDGETGKDILSGGRDNDTIRAGGGDDVVYAGAGVDTTDGGRGNDKVFAETTDTGSGVEQTVTVEIKNLQTFIQVEGTPEFRERVEADLELLGASPRGQEMLQALQKGHEDTEGGWWLWHHEGDSLTIKEYVNPADPNNSSATPFDGGTVIDYNPHIEHLRPDQGAGYVEGPPVTVLQHEFAHALDNMNDSHAPGEYPQPQGNVDNDEREAVGLPIDHDDDPATPEQIYPDHPYGLTENALREEMGAPNRDAY